jgi:two-component system sensor histidine kinase/response regulator
VALRGQVHEMRPWSYDITGADPSSGWKNSPVLPMETVRITVAVLNELDHDLAMSRVGGDAELLKELAELFLDEYPRLFAQLRTGYEQGDARQVESSAHGLKGSVANFGAKRSVDAAFQIEQLGRGGKLEAVAELIHTLELALLALRAELVQL